MHTMPQGHPLSITAAAQVVRFQDTSAEFVTARRMRNSPWPRAQLRAHTDGISPAPRAHLYLAPNTATGISVEYA